MSELKRGDIWLVNFDPTVGAEIKKTRPALVIQNDIANKHSPITIVAAITSTPRLTPTRVAVPASQSGLRVDSVVVLNQVRSVDRRRLVTHLGSVDSKTMAGIDDALRISLGLADF